MEPDNEYSRLELLAQQLNQAHRSAVSAELAARGLGEIGHPVLMTILKYVEEAPEQSVSQRALADLLYISPAAVANSLKSMERGGYIRREPVERDARRNRVLLTDKGREAVEGCEEVFRCVERRMFLDFTPEERALLIDMRARMLRNLLGTTPAKKEEA